MASNVELPSSGYDVQVVGDYPPQLNCGICMFIMKNAMHGCTKHVFCEGCIMKYIECGISYVVEILIHMNKIVI